MEILKKDVTTAPAGCTCEMVELKNQIKDSKVTSWTEKSVCPVCKSLQASAAIAANEQKAEQDKEMKIRVEMDAITRAQAIINLKARGEL